jgi:hypothetical protein
MAKSVEQRKSDLAAAKDQFRRRPKALLSLDELAVLYGLTKPAFVNLRKTIDGFPDPAKREGNAYFYPAYKAASALHEYVMRNEQQALDRGRRFEALVRPPASNGHDHAGLTMSAQEQLRAYELRERLQKEALAQGQLHRSADCAATTERVFSHISRTFGKPTTSMDPTGQWPADVREAVDKAGQALVLRCYAELRDMLGGHAHQQPSGSPDTGARRARPKRSAKARKSRRPVASKH